MDKPGVYGSLEDGWRVVPENLGPTWERNPSWDGDDPFDKYVLPEHTIGWQVIFWVQTWLLDEGRPFNLTFEQRRFILWWYAVDERGRFVYRRGILQRLKGWG